MTQSANGIWPPVLDFISMLQNPAVGFHDAELKSCEIERDANKQPRPRSGNFAVCYKATLNSTKKNVCIRLFSRKADERRERYDQISKHLTAHPIDCLVKFQYVEKGIRHPDPGKVGNKSWFPIVRMDWIEGSILFDWLREKCRSNDTAAISFAAQQWVQLAEQLESAGIAHGDLQHANVMVTPQGHLKLVDYDCMCVPSLVGRPNLELGVEPYQHPERNENTKLFPGIDRFSELFILVVLRALAADPILWFKYIEPPRGEPYDKLLIRKSDFDAPHHSAVFEELKRSSDREVGRLIGELIKLTKVPLANIQSLSTFVFNFDEVRTLFRQRQWDEGLELLDRCQIANLPKDLVAESAVARNSVAARLELERSLKSGNEQQVQAAYQPKLLDNYPKAQPSVQAAKLSNKVQSVIKDLEDARKTQKWRQLVSTWDANNTILTGRTSTNRYRDEVESWRERNGLCDKVRRLKSATPIDATALGDACHALLAKGGHPEIDAEIPEIQLLEMKYTAFYGFQSIPTTPGESNDLALIAAWKENLFAGWKEAEKERSKLSEAQHRLKTVNAIRETIEAADSSRSVDGEKAILKLSRDLPKNYQLESSLKTRIARAKACLQALDPIEKTLDQTSPSEKTLADGWKSLRELKSTEIVSRALRERLELASQRVPLIDKLSAINLKASTDVVDHAIKAAWKNRLLDDCPEASPWKSRAADAFARASLLVELDQAIAATDDVRVVTIAACPLLRKYPFGSTIAGHIEAARKKLEKVNVMISALKECREEDFGRQFDHRVLKAYRSIFVPYQSQIIDVMTREVLPVQKLGLSKPTVGRPIDTETKESNRYQLKWTWPSQRFTDKCVLGICHEMPTGQVDPSKVSVHRIPIDRQRWEAAGGVYALTAKAEWRNKSADVVVVWAVIDLGFDTFFSEPLVLGRIIYQEVLSNRD